MVDIQHTKVINVAQQVDAQHCAVEDNSSAGFAASQSLTKSNKRFCYINKKKQIQSVDFICSSFIKLKKLKF